MPPKNCIINFIFLIFFSLGHTGVCSGKVFGFCSAGLAQIFLESVYYIFTLYSVLIHSFHSFSLLIEHLLPHLILDVFCDWLCYLFSVLFLYWGFRTGHLFMIIILFYFVSTHNKSYDSQNVFWMRTHFYWHQRLSLLSHLNKLCWL